LFANGTVDTALVSLEKRPVPGLASDEPADTVTRLLDDGPLWAVAVSGISVADPAGNSAVRLAGAPGPRVLTTT
jgi:hypothetical protein